MKKTLTATVIALSFSTLALSTTASANFFTDVKPNNFTYNYAELDYVNFNDFWDGFKLSGSYDVKNNISVIGSYSSYDEGRYFDLSRLAVGAVYHSSAREMFPFLEGVEVLTGTDLALHAEIVRYSYDSNTFFSDYSSSSTGLVAGVEGRYKVSNELEAFGDVSISTSDYADFIISAGVRYAVLEQILLTAELELADDFGFSFGARYNF